MSEAFHTDEHELQLLFNETKLPPIRLEERVLEKQRTGSRLMKPAQPILGRRLLGVGGALIAVVLLLGILSAFPASAEQLRKIPVVGKIFDGNIFSFVGDSGMIAGQDGGLSSLLGAEASDKGVTIKLDEVMYDGARLTISYQVDSVKPDYLMFLSVDTAIKINGELIHGATYEAKPRLLNESQAVGVMTIDLGEQELPDSFELELQIGEVSGVNPDDEGKWNQVEGEWSFKLPVVNSALGDSIYKPLDEGYTAAAKGKLLQLTGYWLTPATTKLSFNYVGDIDWLGFQLMDDRGMVIETLDTSFRTDNDGNTAGTVRFAPLAEGTKQIYVTPYRLLVNRENYLSIEERKITTELTNQFPITLSQGAIGEVDVKDVQFMPDKTLIYYEVKGKAPYMQYASLWLETADGDMIISDNGKRTRISDASYDYVLEYPALDPQQPYVLGTIPQTDIQLMNELTVKIDLE